MLEVSVAKSLGSFNLNAQFQCPAKGIVALFGRSGAGKTSLVNALAGLVRPDSGRIAVGDDVLFDSARAINLPPERRRLGYVFQEGRLFPHYSVRGNLLYGAKRAPRDATGVSLAQVVELLGLGDLLARRPRDLSGGEKQRVALGRALLAKPRLLLMDEPLAALDQPRKQEVLPFIERLRDELDLPVVYVTHAMEEIVRLADTMVLIDAGKVAATGPVEEVTGRLELRPLTGRYDAGATLPVTVAQHEPADQLSRLAFDGGELLVRQLDLSAGTRLRVRVRARDVAIALSPPRDSSILNVLSGTVAEVGTDTGALVDLRVQVGGHALWARITKRSLRRLGLGEGTPVYALIKTVAIDRYNVGRGRGSDPADTRSQE
ncbi:molybdenum ABC transporter ATP-binding protein [Rhodovibrio sodomensis]|uniref:Molybdenum ABC transporter ATP-binding protein n=1 Tax=Rhodovibrio sodomensis TaxID=1088 RepID=A0ABS1D9T9_9PROT|nr:molybdenum ABC transporter ATP-binding protein [Rhodovibrio sodomensis]MBK1667186.1 molybdenum ABC transporter ATP-binding protein [Rhodovibrio sodomensis]